MIPGWLDCVRCGREHLNEASWYVVAILPGVIRGHCPICMGEWLRSDKLRH